MMFFLLLSLIPIPAHAEDAVLRIEAREAAGFVKEGQRNRPLSDCAYERELRNGVVSLSLHSDGAPPFVVAETLELPLRDGVIPTFQVGLEAVYEEGELTLRQRRVFGLEEEEQILQLRLDPFLQSIEQASASRWQKNELRGQGREETQRIFCRFR